MEASEGRVHLQKVAQIIPAVPYRAGVLHSASLWFLPAVGDLKGLHSHH